MVFGLYLVVLGYGLFAYIRWVLAGVARRIIRIELLRGYGIPCPPVRPVRVWLLVVGGVVGGVIGVALALLVGWASMVLPVLCAVLFMALWGFGFRSSRPWDRRWRVNRLSAVTRAEQVLPTLDGPERAKLVRALSSAWGGDWTPRMSALRREATRNVPVDVDR